MVADDDSGMSWAATHPPDRTWSHQDRRGDGHHAQAAPTSGYHRIVPGGRLAVVVAWAAIACVMGGCDPAPVPRDPNQISMQLTVGEDGDGTVRLGFGRQPAESQSQLPDGIAENTVSPPYS